MSAAESAGVTDPAVAVLLAANETPPEPAAKPKRKAPHIDPLSPHGIRMGCVGRLIKPEAMAKPGAWGKELHILKRLQLEFNDDHFWLTLQPAERLDSLVWFLGAYGKAALKKEWDMHRFQKAQEQIEIDSQASRSMIEDKPDSSLPAVKPRETEVNWADSATPAE